MLYMPIRPLALARPRPLRNSPQQRPLSSPGTGTSEARRQMPSTIMVNKIRDFSSGILKQLLRVVKMEENIDYSAWQAWPLWRLAALAAFGAAAFCGGFFFPDA